MALNPPLLSSGLPAGLYGETFCIEREGIECTIETHTRELGKMVMKQATLIVTTLRMCVFTRTPTASGLQSFDVPFQGLSGESFQQPIFGANYLAFTVAPVPGRGLVSPATCKLTFNKGGCGVFLKVFFALMSSYKASDAATRAAFLEPPRMQSWLNQTQTAYVDPSDPSRIFLIQPPSAPPPPVDTAPPPPTQQSYWGGGGYAPVPQR